MLDDDAKQLLASVLRECAEREGVDVGNVFHWVKWTESGEAVPIYAATSGEGYGSFLCEYMPLEAIKKLREECERIFDAAEIKTDEKAVRLVDTPFNTPDFREAAISQMMRLATHHLIVGMRRILCEAVFENFKDSLFTADMVLSMGIALVLKEVGIENAKADARDDIEAAAQRAAAATRERLKRGLKEIPLFVLPRTRGGQRKITRTMVRDALSRLGKDASMESIAGSLECSTQGLYAWYKREGFKDWLDAVNRLTLTE